MLQHEIKLSAGGKGCKNLYYQALRILSPALLNYPNLMKVKK